jgi:hypothetical protein
MSVKRYTTKCGLEVTEYISVEIDAMNEADQIVLEFFGGDKRKTRLWFGTKNPLLGGMAPNELINAGKSQRLLKIIKQMRSGELP